MSPELSDSSFLFYYYYYLDLVVVGYSPAADGLIKVNNDHIGFYRVNYENHTWSSISEKLRQSHMVTAIQKYAQLTGGGEKSKYVLLTELFNLFIDIVKTKQN